MSKDAKPIKCKQSPRYCNILVFHRDHKDPYFHHAKYGSLTNCFPLGIQGKWYKVCIYILGHKTEALSIESQTNEICI